MLVCRHINMVSLDFEENIDPLSELSTLYLDMYEVALCCHSFGLILKSSFKCCLLVIF